MIQLITKRDELVQIRKSINSNLTISFVPTMGNLHLGHLELIKQALTKADICFISIFVNPKQFNDSSDLKRYPRTLQQDIEKINKIKTQNKIYLFAPESEQEIYSTSFKTQISVKSLNQILEGEDRPGHFDGVTTVVYLLLKLINPHFAYFGEKDFQQLTLIKQMNSDLDLGISIIQCPTYRDKDGLALSSRNQFLSNNERQCALQLPQAISDWYHFITHHLKNNKDIDFSIIDNEKRKIMTNYSDLKWSYLELRNSDNLTAYDQDTSHFVILAAVQVGNVRLIDNKIFTKGLN